MTAENGQTLHGIGVSEGVAVGPVVRAADPVRPPVDEPPAADVEAAERAIGAALERVAKDLERRAAGMGDPTSSDILTAVAMMARDPSLLAGANRRLRQGLGPANAVDDAVEEVCVSLEAAGGYLAERVVDLRDVRDRVIAHLIGAPQPGIPAVSVPSVLVARDLAPADAAGVGASKAILAVVTESGGPTSHTAILAAQLGVPAVVGVAGGGGLPDAEGFGAAGTLGEGTPWTRHEETSGTLRDGTVVAVDGASGEILLDPDEPTRAEWMRRGRERSRWLAHFNGPGHTRDDIAVALLANVGTVDDARAAAAADIEGVGLFRTEFLYLDRLAAPSVEEQTQTYRTVLRAFGRRRVVVRTLDAGAEKPLPFMPTGRQRNPALGARGMRLIERDETLLTNQLHALAAAAVDCDADVWVMAPMVATVGEARWFVDHARAVGLSTVGVMIEVPAAALRAEQILAEADFASIGTNDLAQYTLAADRTLGQLAPLLDPWQPAVLDLIAATCAGAEAAASTPVGVCGEAAGDPLLALVLVGLGATSLSMTRAKVPAVRAALAMHDYERCVQMAAAARSALDRGGARASVVELLEPDARGLVASVPDRGAH